MSSVDVKPETKGAAAEALVRRYEQHTDTTQIFNDKARLHHGIPKKADSPGVVVIETPKPDTPQVHVVNQVPPQEMPTPQVTVETKTDKTQELTLTKIKSLEDRLNQNQEKREAELSQQLAALKKQAEDLRDQFANQQPITIREADPVSRSDTSSTNMPTIGMPTIPGWLKGVLGTGAVAAALAGAWMLGNQREATNTQQIQQGSVTDRERDVTNITEKEIPVYQSPLQWLEDTGQHRE